MTEARFVRGDDSCELPLVAATEGSNGYDISRLLATTGDVTLDLGFGNTAACRSEITFIDGDAGILRYRGYPIDQLAEHSTFLETSYLVLHGELPTSAELSAFTDGISAELSVDQQVAQLFGLFPTDSHPMAALAAGVNALGAFDPSIRKPGYDRDAVTHRLMARLPILAAHAYRHSVGKPPVQPDPTLGYAENLLRLCFGGEGYQIDPMFARALDVLLILHADHEQNCSTSSVRLVGSSGADLYASVAAGVNALSGALHGGANQAVLEMLGDIRDSGGDVAGYVAKAKDKRDNAKLMGFGHRVYKNYDPRAQIVKQHTDRILADVAGSDELLTLARELEATALADDYFVSRKLYPNVDFYTGLLYQAMGFPLDMFTVLFAIGRLPGWIAHWREQEADPGKRIGRPRQVYTGATERHYPTR